MSMSVPLKVHALMWRGHTPVIVLGLGIMGRTVLLVRWKFFSYVILLYAESLNIEK